MLECPLQQEHARNRAALIGPRKQRFANASKSAIDKTRRPSMTAQRRMETDSERSADLEQRVQKLRQLYSDAPEIGKTALENVIRALESGAPAKEPAAQVESAGRIGRRQGKV
jgi:hypothetical protein